MPDARAVLALLALPRVGDRTVRKVLHIGWQFPLEDRNDDRLPASIATALLDRAIVEQANAAAEAILADARASGANVLTIGDDTYPCLLARTADAPLLLFVEGQLPSVCSLAVVGTRSPTPAGAATARRIAGYFAERGWWVVSGLARGIDAAAHQGAIEARGRTLAVLGHGLDVTHPRQHERLREEIIGNGGCVLSEYPYGTPVAPYQFVARDRIQAGLSAGVICVQTGLEGGSLHACRAALRYGRALAVPQPMPFEQDHSKVQGSLRLLEDAAGFLGVPSGEAFRISSREDYSPLSAALESAIRRSGCVSCGMRA